MKINELYQHPLLEAIDAHGYELVAYCIVIAEQYTKMPTVDPDALDMWNDVIAHNEKMLKKVIKNVNVEFVDNDPYKNQKDMMYDILKNNRMQIFNTTSDDDHPGMSAQENNIFRAIHDYIGHHLPNAKKFAQYLASNNIGTKKDPQYLQFRFARNNFTVRGEINTYITHGKLLPENLRPVLFTEIVGQVATYFVTGDFTTNKVGIMSGIDFKNIGKFTDASLEERKNKYLELLNNESIDSFKTDIGAFNKDVIRWTMVSRGEGQKRK